MWRKEKIRNDFDGFTLQMWKTGIAVDLQGNVKDGNSK